MKNSGYRAHFIAMKTLTTPILATLLALSASGRLAAADPESSFGLAPSAAPQLPQVNPSSLPLIPETPQQNLEKPRINPHQADIPHGDKTSMAEDKLKITIALRQARIKAERDPALQAIYVKALAAHTDFEQRKLFIDYYNGLVDGIVKFNPGMTKEAVDELRNEYVSRFVQKRIAPTIDPAIARAQP